MEYQASFKHIGLNNPKLSLIDDVEIHELVHCVLLQQSNHDMLPDFLVNDVTSDDLPDVIHTSQGDQLPVQTVTEADIVPQADDNFKIMADCPAGWTYLRINEPHAGEYSLVKVLRSDGSEVRLNDNAWTTHRLKRPKGKSPYSEDYLHLLDYHTTGGITEYTLIYQTGDVPIETPIPTKDQETIPPTKTPTPSLTPTFSPSPSPSLTPTPTNTTTPSVSPTPFEEPTPDLTYEFDQFSLGQCGWDEIPGGFAQASSGAVIPLGFLGQPIPSSTDNKGLAIQVAPDDVSFIHAHEAVKTDGLPVLLRAVIRSDNANAIITVSALKGELKNNTDVDGSLGFNHTVSSAKFAGEESRICVLYHPDSGSVLNPYLQVAGGAEGKATVYVDRFEIVKLKSNQALTCSMVTHRNLSPPSTVQVASEDSQPDFIYEFDQNTLSANQWAEIPGGFETRPAGFITPAKNLSEDQMPSSKDGLGIELGIEPKSLVFLMTQNAIDTQGFPALLRITLHSTSSTAEIYFGALKGEISSGMGLDGSIGYDRITTPASFVDQEGRICVVYQPDSGETINPFIQVLNSVENCRVLIDKVEVFLLQPGHAYPVSMFHNRMAPSISPVSTPTPLEILAIDLPGLADGAKPLEMVLIEAGTFTRGSPEDEIEALNAYTNSDWFKNESPQHEVTISQDFYIGKYEVTQSQWEAVMGNNPSEFAGNANHPIESVSWNDCQEFISELNELGLGTFRLPTEAEWEYACRAGTTTRFYWGDDPNYKNIDDYAWYDGNNSPNGTKEVGHKLPNAWDLFDMSGNVYEWCLDRFGDYPSGPVIDPTGHESSSYRVMRGSHWESYAWFCRSADRDWKSPDTTNKYTGLRLVLEYDGQQPEPTPREYTDINTNPDRYANSNGKRPASSHVYFDDCQFTG